MVSWPSYSSSYIGTIDPTAIDVPQSQSRLVGKAVVNAGRVTVPVALQGRSVNAKVFSMQGTTVLDFSDSFAGGSLGFDTSRLPQGNYMLSVQVGSERSVQKVQIK